MLVNRFAVAVLCTACLGSMSWAQVDIPDAANFVDGSFVHSANFEVRLDQAITAENGDWQSINSGGSGVFIPEEWVIVFRYSQVTINSGATITFVNHPSGAPVVWLVNGDATINGIIDLNGKSGHGINVGNPTTSEPGPGGFSGGKGARTTSAASDGQGPGGGRFSSSTNFPGAGSYATVGQQSAEGLAGQVYGNVGVLPLIGGSGGAGNNISGGPGGGAGGGAILIAATGRITLGGTIRANGGAASTSTISSNQGAAGSGGAIRLVADEVIGTDTGRLIAEGGNGVYNGGLGRIRVEANTRNIVTVGDPPYTYGFAQTPFLVTPPDLPVIWPVSVDGVPVPQNPQAAQTADVVIPNAGPNEIILHARNMPTVGSAVLVRAVPQVGAVIEGQAVFQGTIDDGISVWRVTLNLPQNLSTIQARASLPAPQP